MLTGGAPINVDSLNFLKIVTSCPIIEGYGQTETTGGTFLTRIDDNTSGHVGGPNINVEFKLQDVSELDYRSTDIDS